MKKIVIISGAAAIVLSALLFSGMAEADDAAIALRSGNRFYTSGEYEAALSAYGAGLLSNPENERLNFSAGQAAYMLGQYETALGCFEKAGNSLDRFLNMGNAAYRLGEKNEDIEQKLGCFALALETWIEGIEKYPKDVQLKFNYEFVKKKIEDLLAAAKQEGEEGEGEEGEKQEGEGEGAGAGEGEGQEGEDKSAESEEGEGQENVEKNAGSEEGEGAEASEGDEQTVTREEIERILAMLEAQENESLKNNQEAVQGKEGKYAW
jgi:tetratricopeptide (TPR) repeat protein